MKISIALCTYNGEKYLSEQLESFLRQTRLADELVVCDDRSTDQTAAILDDFAARSPFPVRIYINEENLGSNKNFEKAIGLCAGEVIFLSDQDDVWLPHKTARMMAEFEKSPKVGLVFSDAEIVDENLQPRGEKLWDYYFDRRARRKAAILGLTVFILRERNMLTGAAAAFRADFVDLMLPVPTGIYGIIHDGWIALIAASQSEVVPIDEPLIKYRQHELQQIGVFVSEEWEAGEEFYSFCNRLIESNRSQQQRLKAIENALTKNINERRREKFAALFELIYREEKYFEDLTAHFEKRRDLPPAGVKRLKTITVEFLSGRYRRFGRGLLSAAKDLARR